MRELSNNKRNNAMLRPQTSKRSGFTLVELAIVLGVAGVLIGGLWRLLSAGNQQMRDQTVASQQAQLISAVNTYLQSTDGQAHLTAMGAGATTVFIPNNTSVATCAALPVANFCTYLPPGFQNVNAYGQSYRISIKKDLAPATEPAQSYNFMIMTEGGDAIADTSGGRISAAIGGDGGFIYNNSVCGTPAVNYACGAYGAWSTLLSAYNLTGSVGRVASLTYFSSTFAATNPWLSRILLPNSGTPPLYNTMQTPLYLGGEDVFMGSTANAASSGGGQLNLQGGSLVLGPAGGISGVNSTGDYLNNPGLTLSGPLESGSTPSAANALLTLQSTNCVKADYGDETCSYALSVIGDASVSGLLYANSFHAEKFMYTSGAAVSDVRLKDNIKTLIDPLSDLQKLRPVSFTYKKTGESSLGLIAQEVEKVYPDLVVEGPDGFKGIDYVALVSPLIGAVQELKKENELLKEKLRVQEEAQAKLGEKLKALEKKEKAAR
jgi:prepilin-type N-terminal cleavage/methylation domain-containing protein